MPILSDYEQREEHEDQSSKCAMHHHSSWAVESWLEEGVD